MKTVALVLITLGCVWQTWAGVDVFGITQLYPSVKNGPSWNSAHWSNGIARELTPYDAHDPTGWSERTGTGTLKVDGKGVMTMSGSQPRWYLRKTDQAFFVNVEITAYYMRVADAGTFNAGLNMGVRSAPYGHGRDNCDATTYYACLRHDGQCLFDKELEHPYETTRHYVKYSNGMGYNQWIGMKYCAYNIDDGRHVKLEVYVDSTGGLNGGQWKLINETVDNGGWACTENCSYPSDFIITRGGGAVFIRNTDVTDERYKWVSVREIDPQGVEGPFRLTSAARNGRVEVSPQDSVYAKGTLLTLTATPDAGYLFAGWSGDLSGSENPATLTMNGDAVVTALFASTGELIRNGDFSRGDAHWRLDVYDSAAAEAAVGDELLTVKTSATGAEDWSIQLLQDSLTLVSGRQYVLRFTGFSATQGLLPVNVGMSATPWTSFLQEPFVVSLTGTPRTYATVFTMQGATTANARLEFNAGYSRFDWSIDEVSLKLWDGSTAVSSQAGAGLTGSPHRLLATHEGIRFVPGRSETVTICLRDIRGRLIATVFQGTARPGQVITRRLPPGNAAGLYVIHLTAGKAHLVKRLPPRL